jgi:flagellar protein FlaG
MNPLTSKDMTQSLGMMPAPSPSSAQVTKQATKQEASVADSQVVSKVVTAAEVKPSNINEVTQPTRDVVAKAAKEIQSFVQSMGRNLNFSIDQTTGYHIVRVMNPETNEVVRQLPSEELLRIAQSMSKLNSALVNQRA